MAKQVEPPKTLGRRGAMLWRAALAEADPSPEELAELERFCQAFDAWQAAAETVNEESPLTTDPPPAGRPPGAAPGSRVPSETSVLVRR